MNKITYLLLLMLCTNMVLAQNKKGNTKNKKVVAPQKVTTPPKRVYRVRATIVNGDTLAMIYLPTFMKVDNYIFKNKHKKSRYDKLVRDVKKTYPYAKLAAFKLKSYAPKLAGKTEEEKKKIMKQVEKDLVKEFRPELENLTVTQGHILLKLIDRESGNTTYQLLEDLRGEFSAVFWQSLARIFSTNLKDRYDPNGEDREIENIILLIDKGMI